MMWPGIQTEEIDIKVWGGVGETHGSVRIDIIDKKHKSVMFTVNLNTAAARLLAQDIFDAVKASNGKNDK